MAKTIAGLFCFLLAPLLAAAAPPAVVLTEVVSGLVAPLDIRFAPGVTNRMYIVEKGGRIRVANGNVLLPAPFLDLSGIVRTDGERGVHGLVFHPDYENNRAFYVHYAAADNSGALTIARYLRDPSNPNIADPSSGVILFSTAHDQSGNHNGGGMHFGPDGLLYISMGDGGTGGLESQSPNTRLGKILRIAVDGGPGYTIPAGNRYPAGGTCATSGCPETLHIGFRNPWRFSFDRLTGQMYIGDVGQGLWEEIDLLAPGAASANFGWGAYEGNACYNDNLFGSSGACAALAGHTRPVHTYLHDIGGSISGGFVYRGSRIVGLGGYYIYGDYVTSELFAGRMNGGNWENFSLAPATVPYISTFGQDADGELYTANVLNGRIYRIDPAPGAPDPAADADNDGVPNGIEGTVGLNAFAKDNDVFANPRLFAMQQYRDFLGREGEAPGVQYYMDQLNSGGTTRHAMIASFLASPEFAAGLPSIIRLYFAFFNRIPDYGGLTFQVAALRAGTPLASIAQNFYNAPEFTNTYGALSNAAYINLVYQNVLGRAPDPGGYDYYFTRLESGELTKGQMMVGFSESPEFQQLMDNECWAISVYVGLLRRTPEVAGLAFYVTQLDAGTPRSSIIPGFADSPEYRGRFLP